MNFNRKVILMLFIAIFITSTFAMTRSVHAAIWNVVPGPNAIQNAINAAAPFDTINVAAGIYPEAITINKQLSLIGAPGAIIQPVAANPLQDGGVRRAGIYITANGVTVQGFEIDGTKTMVNYGIYGLDTSNLVLTGNVIHDMTNSIALGDNSGVGILIYGYEAACNNNLISGNVVYNTGRMGIIICAWSDLQNGWLVCNGNTISWNVVYNTWQGPTNDGGGGIQVNGAKNTHIFDNKVHDTKAGWFYVGIYAYGSDIGNSITCNDVYNNAYGIVTWIDGGGGVVGLVATTPATETNNIYYNTALGVYNIAAPTLDATHNWWGSGVSVSGPVDSTNPLTTLATCAPYYVLTVNSAYDSPSPAIGPNNEPPGWSVTASVSSAPVFVGGAQYICTSYTGTGSVVSGSGTTLTFTITQDSSITWNWILSACFLTVNSAYGTTSGQNWYTVNQPVTFSVSPTTVTVGTTRYVFTGWTSSDPGGYTGSANPGSVTMTNPITETAIWKTQYYLTVVTNPSGIGTIPGAGWYDQGTHVTLTAPINLGVYSLITAPFSWDVDGTSQGVANPITVTMTAPHTATAHYTNLSIGGQWAPITMQSLSPINTLGLLAPWIALALIAAATALATYRRLCKKHSIPTSA